VTSVFLSGLVVGSMYALAGLGLTLEYRTSRIVNFAHGAQAMIAAFIFVKLRPDLGLVGAMAVSLCVAGFTGAVVERLSVKMAAGRGAMNQVIVTLGIFLLLQGIATEWFGQNIQYAPAIFEGSHKVFGVFLSRDQVVVLLLGPLVAFALWAFLRFTPVGLRLRAVADRREQASLIGLHTPRLVLGAWVLGSILAGLAGIFLTPLLLLDPVVFSLLIIAAYAALLLGGMESLILTVLGGFGLGLAQQIATYNFAKVVGIREVVAFGLAVIALTVQSKRLEWT